MSKFYEWSLIKGCQYEKNIENFAQMCKACHLIYDRSIDWREKLRVAHKRQKLEKIKVKSKIRSLLNKLIKENFKFNGYNLKKLKVDLDKLWMGYA